MLSQYLTQKNADDLNFIKQILHKSGFLNVQNIIRLRSGSRSVAYYADGYIVRFPKAEIIWQTMKREKNIIDMVYLKFLIIKKFFTSTTNYFYNLIYNFNEVSSLNTY